jgi:hypothetical protein
MMDRIMFTIINWHRSRQVMVRVEKGYFENVFYRSSAPNIADT